MKVAVIGPFYRGKKHVKGWLNCLALQTHADTHLYLVDDSSSDGTAELLDSALKNCKISGTLLALKENAGPSGARNIAIRRALSDGAELILLLDMDCRVQPDWVERHVRAHTELAEAAVIGGAIQGVASSPVGIADGFCSWFTAVPYTGNGAVNKMHLSSTNMSIKPHVFEAVGFFDESLATGEDVAFCRKVQKAGLLLWRQTDIIMLHLDREDFSQARRHHFRWGLHSYTLSLQAQGGYYGILKKLNSRLLVALLVPLIAFLNTALILYQFAPRSPRVFLYLPWILLLKWSNALGVYHGYLNPSLCLRKVSVSFQA